MSSAPSDSPPADRPPADSSRADDPRTDDPRIDAAGDDSIIAATLARNDRYLREFIEALAICPYARTCRETGRLHREVLLHKTPDADALVQRILDLSTPEHAEIEVGLLILPNLALSATDFDRFVRGVQRSYQQKRPAGVSGYFVVAFHPENDMRLDNPDVAVRFMRRSPDPTIQIVRPEAIARLCGERDREILSRNIAEAGLRAVQTHGPHVLAALLGSMRASGNKTP